MGLEILGLSAHHFPLALFGQPELIGAPAFKPALKRGLRQRWQLHRELKALRQHSPLELLDGYDAFADLPIPHFFKQLDVLYPDAKFIHTMRTLDEWLPSMEWLLARGRRERGWLEGEIADELHYSIYGCKQFDAAILKDAFESHYDSVVRHFSGRPEKLLILNLSEGELCFERIAPFLNLPVPEISFPNSNARS